MRVGRAAAMVWAGLALAAAAPTGTVADLGWLSGAWVSRNGDAWTEEWWTPPRGGIMIGAGFSGRGETATSFEHMRIMADKAGTIAFYGMPGGTPAVAFPLVLSSKDEAVFENPAHDYPQRIRYRMEGETLVATVSLIDGSRAESWRYRRLVQR
ncbi:DUF6265 family protein [Allosphingosinicella humi]